MSTAKSLVSSALPRPTRITPFPQKHSHPPPAGTQYTLHTSPSSINPQPGTAWKRRRWKSRVVEAPHGHQNGHPDIRPGGSPKRVDPSKSMASRTSQPTPAPAAPDGMGHARADHLFCLQHGQRDVHHEHQDGDNPNGLDHHCAQAPRGLSPVTAHHPSHTVSGRTNCFAFMDGPAPPAHTFVRFVRSRSAIHPAPTDSSG